MSNLFIIPCSTVVDYDADLEKRQLSIRLKGSTAVAGGNRAGGSDLSHDKFHKVIDEEIKKKYGALCTYITYRNVVVTLEQNIDHPLMNDMIKHLAATSGAKKAESLRKTRDEVDEDDDADVRGQS